MDPFLARTMVETLSKGINPVTGRALPMSDSCANEEIQDALIEVLEHCMIESAEQYSLRMKEEKHERHEEKCKKSRKIIPGPGSHGIRPKKGKCWIYIVKGKAFTKSPAICREVRAQYQTS